MKIYLKWQALVIFFIFIGGLTGWLMGEILRAVNLDYVVDVHYYFDKGWRTGLVLATFLGVCWFAGGRRTPSFPAVILAGSAVFTGVVLIAFAVGSAAYLLSRFNICRLPIEVTDQIGNPNRIFFCEGIKWGAAGGAVLSGLTAGIFVRRKRSRS